MGGDVNDITYMVRVHENILMEPISFTQRIYTNLTKGPPKSGKHHP